MHVNYSDLGNKSIVRSQSAQINIDVLLLTDPLWKMRLQVNLIKRVNFALACDRHMHFLGRRASSRSDESFTFGKRSFWLRPCVRLTLHFCLSHSSDKNQWVQCVCVCINILTVNESFTSSRRDELTSLLPLNVYLGIDTRTGAGNLWPFNCFNRGWENREAEGVWLTFILAPSASQVEHSHITCHFQTNMGFMPIVVMQ